MAGIEIRRFEEADERRAFALGAFELVSLGGVTIGRASYEPGWVWSEHIGKPAGGELCDVRRRCRLHASSNRDRRAVAGATEVPFLSARPARDR